MKNHQNKISLHQKHNRNYQKNKIQPFSIVKWTTRAIKSIFKGKLEYKKNDEEVEMKQQQQKPATRDP